MSTGSAHVKAGGRAGTRSPPCTTRMLVPTMEWKAFLNTIIAHPASANTGILTVHSGVIAAASGYTPKIWNLSDLLFIAQVAAAGCLDSRLRK